MYFYVDLNLGTEQMVFEILNNNGRTINCTTEVYRLLIRGWLLTTCSKSSYKHGLTPTLAKHP